MFSPGQQMSATGTDRSFLKILASVLPRTLATNFAIGHNARYSTYVDTAQYFEGYLLVGSIYE